MGSRKQADCSICLSFQETPTKELGHCGGEAHGPGPSSPAASTGSPYLGRCMNSESSTDEEGTVLSVSHKVLGGGVCLSLKQFHYVDQVHLSLKRDSPVSVSQVLGIKDTGCQA